MSEAPERIWATPDGYRKGEGAGVFVEVGHKWPAAPNADAVEYIRADLVPQWQSIETAPKDDRSVLVATDQGICGMASFFENGGWWWDKTYGEYYADPIEEFDGNITHWMPLPTPPKGAE